MSIQSIATVKKANLKDFFYTRILFCQPNVTVIPLKTFHVKMCKVQSETLNYIIYNTKHAQVGKMETE